eukprot:5863735-Prymnesium_polylepis.1
MYTHGTGREESTRVRVTGRAVTRGEKSDGLSTREPPSSSQKARSIRIRPLRWRRQRCGRRAEGAEERSSRLSS